MNLTETDKERIRKRYGFSAERIIKCLGKARDDMKIYDDDERGILIHLEEMERKIRKHDSFSINLGEAQTIEELGRFLNIFDYSHATKKMVYSAEMRELLSYYRYESLEEIEEIIKELKEAKKKDHLKKTLKEKERILKQDQEYQQRVIQEMEKYANKIAEEEKEITEIKRQLMEGIPQEETQREEKALMVLPKPMQITSDDIAVMMNSRV